MRFALLVGLRVVDRGLDYLSRASDRVVLRRFLKDNPSVRFRPWTDGT